MSSMEVLKTQADFEGPPNRSTGAFDLVFERSVINLEEMSNASPGLARRKLCLASDIIREFYESYADELPRISRSTPGVCFLESAKPDAEVLSEIRAQTAQWKLDVVFVPAPQLPLRYGAIIHKLLGERNVQDWGPSWPTSGKSILDSVSSGSTPLNQDETTLLTAWIDNVIEIGSNFFETKIFRAGLGLRDGSYSPDSYFHQSHYNRVLIPLDLQMDTPTIFGPALSRSACKDHESSCKAAWEAASLCEDKAIVAASRRDRPSFKDEYSKLVNQCHLAVCRLLRPVESEGSTLSGIYLAPKDMIAIFPQDLCNFNSSKSFLFTHSEPPATGVARGAFILDYGSRRHLSGQH